MPALIASLFLETTAPESLRVATFLLVKTPSEWRLSVVATMFSFSHGDDCPQYLLLSVVAIPTLPKCELLRGSPCLSLPISSAEQNGSHVVGAQAALLKASESEPQPHMCSLQWALPSSGTQGALERPAGPIGPRGQARPGTASSAVDRGPARHHTAFPGLSSILQCQLGRV